VVTHTAQRLRRTLLGVSCQTARPASVTVTCDADDESIREAVVAACAELGMSVRLVRRAGHELSRAGQARNNAVRALLGAGAGDGSALVFLDGDCVAEPALVGKHLALLGRGGLVLGWRFEMTPAQTEAFDEGALRAGRLPIEPTRAQWAALRRRHRRFVRQAVMRRVGLGKAHKPKLLGANFALSLADYRRVNGHDETYEGWGQEDDDLGRRLYMAGVRPVIGVARVLSFHQWHETRAPRRLEEGRNAHRLEETCAMRCARGLEDPVEQHEVRVEMVG
jgi:hypothetical protein